MPSLDAQSPLPAAPHVTTVRDAAAFAALAGEWDELVIAAPRPSPFLLHAWLEEWWRHFGAGAELLVLTARRGDRLVGALPLFVRRRRGLRVARFLGDHESALGDLLLRDPQDEAAGRVLLDALRAERFSYADLFGLPEGSALGRVAPRDALTVLPRVEAPVMLMPDGYQAAYTAKTSSKKRNLHKRRLRQLAELGELRFDTARTLEELEPALEEAFAIHERRWEGRPDGSTFGTPAGRAFHRDALARIAADDVPRIVTLRIDGRAVAFHYYFVLGETMYVHRLAFDPEISRLSPGQVTTLHTLAVASEEGCRRVEFLGGDERYKLELADRLEPMGQGLGLAHDPLGALAGRATIGVIEARKRLKRSERLRTAYVQGLAPVRRVAAGIRRTRAEA